MFGTLGGPEVILILVIALIVFGPRQLPGIGRSMGKMLAEFRKASNEFKRTIEDEVDAEERRTALPAPPAEAPETAVAASVPEVAPAEGTVSRGEPAAGDPPVNPS